MANIAFVFAGQGAQKTGMGKELTEISPAAAKVFEDADKARPGTSEQCFTADSEELKKTSNTQPCVYTVDLAAAEALREKGIVPAAVAGYSLGEIAALTFSGAFSPEEGMKFVTARGLAMQKASEMHDTGMVAVLKLDNDTIKELASKYNAVYPVNFNCAGQVTVAGDKEELEGFKADVKAAKGLPRVIPVAGGFHSPFMEPALDDLQAAADQAVMNETQIPVYSNYTTKPYEGDYKELMVKQVVNPLRWQESIENMIADGIDTFIEVGPGTALTKMITRISKDVAMYHVEDKESLEETLEQLL